MLENLVFPHVMNWQVHPENLALVLVSDSWRYILTNYSLHYSLPLPLDQIQYNFQIPRPFLLYYYEFLHWGHAYGF